MRAWWTSCARLWHLASVVAHHALAYALRDRLERWTRLARRLPAADLDPPERLRTIFEDLGGTFVKFGQMLALQPDIVPMAYCNALFKLLDRVEPFPFSEVERVCREELGRRPDEIFTSFERRPLATASVGQVHVAYLGGQKVAVKIQRPSVELEFGSDIRLMTAAIRIITWLHLKPLYWLLEPLTEFIGWTREELDYRYEARYSERMRKLAAENSVQYVPRVYEEYTTRRILVAEFLAGTTLLAYLRACEQGDEAEIRDLEPRHFDRKRFAAHVIDNFLGDAFTNGIYHADLHPANLLILDDNVVGYIDFGITGVMSRHSRRHLVAMTLALAQGDMETLSAEFLEVSAFDPKAKPQAFRAGLDQLARGWYQGEGEDRRLRANFTRIMGDMLTLSRQTGVLPERDIIKYIRSSIAIDGLITRFAPEFNVGRYLGESCARHLMWQGRRDRFAPQRLLDWSAAGGKLLHDAPMRAFRLLDRLASGEFPARTEADGKDERDAGLRARALELAGAVAGVALLLAGAADPQFGFNLWTAELTFAAAAGTMLLDTVRRLVFRTNIKVDPDPRTR